MLIFNNSFVLLCKENGRIFKANELKTEREQVHRNFAKWGQILCLCVQIHVHMPQCFLTCVPANLPLCLLLSVDSMCTVEFFPFSYVSGYQSTQ